MDHVEIEQGFVAGFLESGGEIRTFRGIPYAAPPVGDLRWRPPGPPAPWSGTRSAAEFGPRCVQARVFADMVFRDDADEDCLHLNVWTPARAAGERLPVMVWIHGGGFVAGSASEPRQDGAELARQGVVVVGINYRLGVFGFFAHPELTADSEQAASGNQGLHDQVAALEWVRRNIAAFGGDADNVTIFGESAGSLSVSALMAAPLARGLFHRAVGESGACFGAPGQGQALPMLGASEEGGLAFAEALGADTLAAMRARPAAELLKAVKEGGGRFAPTIDGHLLPDPPSEVFARGGQSPVPLLAGWNRDELRALDALARPPTTVQKFTERVRQQFGSNADAVLSVYPASSDAEALESAASLRSDLFVGYATWKWLEVHAETSGAPVYRFSFDRKIPLPPDGWNGVPATSEDVGARHAGEIEYVFGALDWRPDIPWQPSDRALSRQMAAYWTHFARAGDPNGGDLPEWPRYSAADGFRLIHLDGTSRAAPDARRGRYETLDAISRG